MTKDELKERFRQFSLRIINLVNSMPNTIAGNAIAKQIIRSVLRLPRITEQRV